jgi:hypothetical protein
MYHLELRQFPHNVCRFNLTDAQLHQIVEPWMREKFVDVGERKWHRDQARLTIVEGPRLGPEQLTMGRGWRAAQRQGDDVTERVLAAAKQAVEAASHASAQARLPDAPPTSDPPALGALDDLGSVAALLGSDPIGLLGAWRAVAASSPGLAPSESLALAEHALTAARPSHS